MPLVLNFMPAQHSRLTKLTVTVQTGKLGTQEKNQNADSEAERVQINGLLTKITRKAIQTNNHII